MSAWGRVRQTMQVVFAWSRPVDDALAQCHLSEAEFRLYQSMSRAARQHHLRVAKDLLANNHTHPDLLKAALLHDVGKTRYPFRLPDKIIVVVAKALVPSLFERWSNGTVNSWRRPFVVSAHHPQWGAEMGEQIGMSALSLELIRHHQSQLPKVPQNEADQLLALLQAADDRS